MTQYPAPFTPMAPILRADRSPVEDFVSTPGWKEIRRASDFDHADAAPVTADWFLDEPHHRYYGRPWVMGRYYFDQILGLGLDRSARVLDLGCGAGRLGGLLTAYLDAGCYFGVDNHLRSLVAFAGYECFIHDLLGKRPNLLWSDDFEIEAFGARFDLVLDCFVSAHLPPEKREGAFRRIAAAVEPGGRLIVLSQEDTAAPALDDAGFRLSERREVRYPLLESAAAIKQTDIWNLYVRV